MISQVVLATATLGGSPKQRLLSQEKGGYSPKRSLYEVFMLTMDVYIRAVKFVKNLVCLNIEHINYM